MVVSMQMSNANSHADTRRDHHTSPALLIHRAESATPARVDAATMEDAMMGTTTVYMRMTRLERELAMDSIYALADEAGLIQGQTIPAILTVTAMGEPHQYEFSSVTSTHAAMRRIGMTERDIANEAE